MTSLNSINYSGVSNYNKSQISASTKRKLESLGIDPNLVTSESHALSLIAARQSERSFEQYTVQKSAENEQAQQTEAVNNEAELYSAMSYRANNLRYLLGL